MREPAKEVTMSNSYCSSQRPHRGKVTFGRGEEVGFYSQRPHRREVRLTLGKGWVVLLVYPLGEG